MHTTSTRATSRTWATVTVDRPFGEYWGTVTNTVTIYRTPDGLRATVDGQDATVLEAHTILSHATTRTVTAETLEPTPRAVGKATAHELHRELGRLRFRDHYAAASEGLGVPVRSLAALTAEDVQTVRSYARGQWGLIA